MANFQKINQLHVPKMTSSVSIVDNSNQKKLLDKKKHLTPQKWQLVLVVHKQYFINADARGPDCWCYVSQTLLPSGAAANLQATVVLSTFRAGPYAERIHDPIS